MLTKIIVLGDTMVGKTSIVHKFCFPNDTVKVHKTIGIDCTSRVLNFDNKLYKIQFWDVAGGTEWMRLYPKYIKNVDIALVVYDVSNEQSFLNIKKWIKMVRDIQGSKFPIVVLANKIDKETTRKIHHESYKIYTKQFDEHVFTIETTTVTRDGCAQALQCILSQLGANSKKVTTVTKTTWNYWFS